MMKKFGIFKILFAICCLFIGISLSIFVAFIITDDFNTSDVNIAEKNIIKVYASASEGYYLSSDGTLYSPGADSDAGAYVKYINKTEGIVGKNVIDFGTLSCGGYYINNKNELYFWNTRDLPKFNYKENKQMKILDNVSFVKFFGTALIYIDLSNNLYLVGEFNDESYSIDNPKLLAKNVYSADINCLNGKDFIIWVDNNSNFGKYGQIFDWCDLSYIKNKINIDVHTNFKLEINDNSIILLQDDNLWYYGNYNSLISDSANSNFELTLLCDNAINFASDSGKIVAITKNNSSFIWGKYLANDSHNTEKKLYDYFENRKVLDNVISVTFIGDYICFSTKDYQPNIFGSANNWGFEGNSTNVPFVGINNKPITWI